MALAVRNQAIASATAKLLAFTFTNGKRVQRVKRRPLRTSDLKASESYPTVYIYGARVAVRETELGAPDGPASGFETHVEAIHVTTIVKGADDDLDELGGEVVADLEKLLAGTGTLEDGTTYQLIPQASELSWPAGVTEMVGASMRFELRIGHTFGDPRDTAGGFA